MNVSRRYRVTYSFSEVVAALKAHNPRCLTTQAIPVNATLGATQGGIDLVWEAAAEKPQKEPADAE